MAKTTGGRLGERRTTGGRPPGPNLRQTMIGSLDHTLMAKPRWAGDEGQLGRSIRLLILAGRTY